MQSVLSFHNVTLSFPAKICFSTFSATVRRGQRIGIIGPNGAGKSCLLKLITGQLAPTHGDLVYGGRGEIQYVPQHMLAPKESGGEARMTALQRVLRVQPELLLLDEPTNDLDHGGRAVLDRGLTRFQGALLVVSHDETFLAQWCDEIWAFEGEGITVFKGGYMAYRAEGARQERERLDLYQQAQHAQKKGLHERMKGQARQAKRKTYGQKKYAGDKLARRAAAQRGENTRNQQDKRCGKNQAHWAQQHAQSYRPASRVIDFGMEGGQASGTLVQIVGGTLWDGRGRLLMEDIHLQLSGGERVGLLGKNGAGKSTLLRAIQGDPSIQRAGDWHLPAPQKRGYIDQHCARLNAQHTLLGALQEQAPLADEAQLRAHLHVFGFVGKAVLQQRVGSLSGGERVRLAFARMALQRPQLLLLDEVTNGIDLPLKRHLEQLLRTYSGAMIVVSHDRAFMDSLALNRHYLIHNKRLQPINGGES